MSIREYIAKELRKLRAEKKVTQSEVARATNIEIGAIVRYENATVSIKLDRLHKLLKYYNINLSDFFKSF